jgi:hypothetical protein
MFKVSVVGVKLNWVRLGSFMVSPPFATAKAGDDFPFRNPSTNGAGKMPNIQRKFLKKFFLNDKMRPPAKRGQAQCYNTDEI